MFDDPNQLFSILSSNGVEFEETITKDWSPVLCYSHNDKHIGNAFINVESGVTNCFACGASYSLYQLLKIKNPGMTFEDYIKIVGLSETYVEEKTAKRSKPVKEERLKHEIVNGEIVFDFSKLQTERFDPMKYDYTRQRGFTRDFIDHFGIRLVSSGYYKNYIAIPVKDEEKKIHTIEFRKVGDNSKDKKVLYPAGISVKRTIFNRENLRLDHDLWIKEGVSGIPKIWSNISKNVTAIFGAGESEEQIKILKQFSAKKIFIPDNDNASAALINRWAKELDNLYIVDVMYDDKEEEFLNDLKTCEILKPWEYLLKYYGLDDWRIV